MVSYGEVGEVVREVEAEGRHRGGMVWGNWFAVGEVRAVSKGWGAAWYLFRTLRSDERPAEADGERTIISGWSRLSLHGVSVGYLSSMTSGCMSPNIGYQQLSLLNFPSNVVELFYLRGN